MPTINFEFKARAGNIAALETQLLTLNPQFAGEDHQVDTYFNVPEGRLKLREGNIENALIFYERKNTAGAKQSDIILYQHQPDKNLKDILTRVNGIKVVVDKRRKIYFINNVKFHFDTLEGLGTFVEVEAIDRSGAIGVEQLQEQCNYYARFFGIEQENYVAQSYSDLIMQKNASRF
ncbi:MAG: class IV adenylate cyclase [Bacteroidetes bacterium]|nr:class IV adenylate cyclase [Bacteroidota bacterium]